MYIGIDLGTSGVKTILIDHNQKILSVAHASLDVHSPQDGFNEQDPLDWIKATENCFPLHHAGSTRVFRSIRPPSGVISA